MTEQPIGVELRLQWTGLDDAPLFLTNQFLGQVGQQDEVVLTFGQVALPALMGTPEQQAEQAAQIPGVPIRTLARFALTRGGLDELIGVLEQTRANHDKSQQMKGGEAV